MPDNRKPPVLLTTADAAEVLGVQPRTLEDWRRRGEGPPYVRLSATRIRYSLSALDEWLSTRTVSAVVQ